MKKLLDLHTPYKPIWCLQYFLTGATCPAARSYLEPWWWWHAMECQTKIALGQNWLQPHRPTNILIHWGKVGYLPTVHSQLYQYRHLFYALCRTLIENNCKVTTLIMTLVFLMSAILYITITLHVLCSSTVAKASLELGNLYHQVTVQTLINSPTIP